MRNVVAHSNRERHRTIWIVDNISAGGLFVRSEDVLPLGEHVELDLVRPGMKKALALEGRVVLSIDGAQARRRGVSSGMGIEFHGLTDDTRKRLDDLLRASGSPTNTVVTDLRPAPSEAAEEGAAPERAAQPLSSIRRRAHRRVESRRVLAHLRVDGEVVELGLRVDNLSLGGCFVSIDAPPPAGAQVTLEFVHPSLEKPLALAGTVVSGVSKARADEQGLRAGIAVRFGGMKRGALQRLRGLLGTLVPLAATDFRDAPAATDVLPDDPEPMGPGFTPEVEQARAELFGHDSLELELPLSSTPRELLEAELARLREDVKRHLRRISEIEAYLANAR